MPLVRPFPDSTAGPQTALYETATQRQFANRNSPKASHLWLRGFRLYGLPHADADSQQLERSLQRDPRPWHRFSLGGNSAVQGSRTLPQPRKWIAPEKSPSWKLDVQGAEALTDGTVGDSDGNLGAADSLHTRHTEIPLIRAASARKHDVRRKASTGPANHLHHFNAKNLSLRHECVPIVLSHERRVWEAVQASLTPFRHTHGARIAIPLNKGPIRGIRRRVRTPKLADWDCVRKRPLG